MLKIIEFLLYLFKKSSVYSIFHLNLNWLPGGFLGVDLFFVLSGYLMTSITLSDIDTGKFSIANFYRKRIKRILPAYFVLLFLVTIIGVNIYLYTDFFFFFRSLRYSLLFLSNLIFSEGDSYFGASLSENPFLHTWSLSIEMQFYLILPFIIIFFKKYLKIFVVLMILIFTIYSSYNIYFLDNKSLMYFSLGARIPEFLVGSLYAILFKRHIDFGRNINNMIAFLSLLFFILCLFLISENSEFPGFLVLLPTILIANLLVLNNNFISIFFSNKILVKIGEYSYSLYLWHWPVMALMRYRLDRYEFNYDEILLVIFFTLILSWLSYRFIENASRWFSDVKFMIIYISIFIVLFFVGFKYKNIFEYKKIPDLYSKPYFGIESHGTDIVQKIGDLSKNDSILLLGNSHANMLKPFLHCIGKGNNFSVITYTNSGYMAIDGIKDEDVVSLDQLRRLNISRAKIAFVRELIENNRIIIINNSVDFNKLPSVRKAFEDLIVSLKPHQKIILLNTFPGIDKNLFKINSGFKKVNNINVIKKDDKIAREILLEIENKYPNVYLYDISKSKIFNTPGYINDTIAYYDKGHINTFASLKLAKDLEKDFMIFFNEVRAK